MINNSTKQNLKVEKEQRESSVIRRYQSANTQRTVALVAFLGILAAYVFYLFILFTLSPKVLLPGDVWFIAGSILHIVIYAGFRFLLFDRQLRLSQDVVFCTAVSAAEQLEEGDPIKASLLVDKLLAALSHFLRHKSVKIGPWGFTAKLKDLLYVHPESVPRKAILGAIQDSGSEMPEFSQHFYSFAQGLSSESERDNYIVTQNFLSWLINKSEKYKLKPAGLWERHPGFKDILLSIILPIIGAIIVLVVRIIFGL